MRKEQVLVLVLLALPIAAVSFSATAVPPRIFSGAGQMRALHREGLNEISGLRIKCKTGKCPRRVLTTTRHMLTCADVCLNRQHG